LHWAKSASAHAPGRPSSYSLGDIGISSGNWPARTSHFQEAVSPTTGSVVLEFMNLFDNINYNPVFNPGAGASIFQVTSAFRDTGVDVNDPGGRLGQLVWRVSW
jgi:hypothetical protein